jgi:hypothetical protein
MSKILTPQSFVQTSDGKNCYLYTGLGVTLNTSYQDILNAEIGLRDIKVRLQFVGNWQKFSSSVLGIRMYLDEEEFYFSRGYGQSPAGNTAIQDDVIHLILPRNTKLRIEAKSEAGSSYEAPFGVNITGKYIGDKIIDE